MVRCLSIYQLIFGNGSCGKHKITPIKHKVLESEYIQKSVILKEIYDLHSLLKDSGKTEMLLCRAEKGKNIFKVYLLFQYYQKEIIGVDLSQTQIHHKTIIEKAELKLNISGHVANPNFSNSV